MTNTDLFTGKAEVYADARPSYPDAALDYIVSLIPQGATVADIGAGVSKPSILLTGEMAPVHDLALP